MDLQTLIKLFCLCVLQLIQNLHLQWMNGKMDLQLQIIYIFNSEKKKSEMWDKLRIVR